MCGRAIMPTSGLFRIELSRKSRYARYRRWARAKHTQRGRVNTRIKELRGKRCKEGGSVDKGDEKPKVQSTLALHSKP